MAEWIFVTMLLWNGRIIPETFFMNPTNELNCFKSVRAVRAGFSDGDQNRSSYFAACLPPPGVDHIPEALLEDSDERPDV